jgi:hypothetical protein
MRFVVAVISMMALLAPAWAQSGACSTATIHGTYSVTCSGYLSPAQGAPQVPISLIGTGKSDYGGNFAGTGKVSLGGAILDFTAKTSASAPAVVNSDCTGTITYIQTIGGQAAPLLNIVFHVLDGGKTMVGMGVDAGATMSCTLRLMSYAGY